MARAGEYAVASELLLRGVSVHFPAVDAGDGIDLLAGGVLRIQVKTSTPHSYRYGGYVFTPVKRMRLEGYRNYRTKYLDWTQVDYLICVGMGEPRRFWVIPAAFFIKYRPEAQSLMLGTKHQGAPVDHEEIVRLFQAGKSQAQIAREMGISPMAVSTHVRGVHGKSMDKQLAKMLDAFEDGWGGLLSNVKLVAQMELSGAEDSVDHSSREK